MERRNFIKNIGAGAMLINTRKLTYSNKKAELKIGANGYNWITFYNRAGKKWGENWDECIADFSKTGIKYFEPSIHSIEEARILADLCKKNGIQLYSIYVNSILHDNDEAFKTITFLEELSTLMANVGTKIFVTNPNPIKWGSEDLKSDTQLATQAQNLDRVGEMLLKKGIKLAYHTHDVELKAGAREFHHMLQNTNPKFVYFCFDVHWVYIGAANSQAAVFDVLKMYYNRIIELHLRQSDNHIWNETFTATGDIDYNKIAQFLKSKKVNPFLMIEQCLETKTISKLDAVTAHIIDLQEVKKVFGI